LLGFLVFFVVAAMTTCSAAAINSQSVLLGSSYLADDEDILAAEDLYLELEQALQEQIEGMEETHPDFDDYQYQIDELSHDPYALISYLTVMYGEFEIADVEDAIEDLFQEQYNLYVWEETETRTREVTREEERTVRDPRTGRNVTQTIEVTETEEYEATILNIRLNNRGLEPVIFGELDEEIIAYIEALSVQDDFIDLSNEVAVNYNTMLEENAELSAFLTNFSEEVNKSVGKEVASATAEASGESTDAATQDTSAAGDSASNDAASTSESKETATDSTASGPVIIEATTVVKIRSSDSTNADVLGKTEVGQQFTQIEALANGWSKIEYEGKTAYVRTEYFTVVSDGTDNDTKTESTDDSTDSKNTESKDTDTKETDTKTTETKETETKESDTASTENTGVTSNGTYHVKETVRIRKSASTESEVLGNAYQGDEIKVTNYRADGWCEVEYNGIKGFVKTEYLTK
jgi:uncharacterized protein YgiM (DUF1202 family)